MRLAFCDDNPEDLSRMVRLLEEMRAAGTSAPFIPTDVLTFSHPDELLKAAAKAPFDLYLLDVMMDMLSGLQLVKELRRFQQRPRVIFFSTSREFAYEAFQLRAVTYLAKPYTREQFESALTEALALADREAADCVTLGTEGNIRRFSLRELEYVTLADTSNYVCLHLADGSTVVTRYSMRALAEDFRPRLNLVAANRGLLVNPARVLALSGSCVRLMSGARLEIPHRSLKPLQYAILACSAP